MPVTLTIQQIPIGSQLTGTIGADDPDSKNDFSVLILLDANGTGLTESNITFSTGASLVELTGDNAVWEATIRPPETAAVITMTIAADAFSEGNAETTQDIRISTRFPDDDAETPTELFATTSRYIGIAVSPTHIVISIQNRLRFYTHDGTEQTGRELTITNNNYKLDYFNETVLTFGDFGLRRFALVDGTQIDVPNFQAANQATLHTRIGLLRTGGTTFHRLPYAETNTANATAISTQLPFPYRTMAHQDDLLYLTRVSAVDIFVLAEIIDASEITFRKILNINRPENANIQDMALYQDTLYILGSGNNSAVYTLDIRPYRPLAKNTKTTIYPVFANEGDTIPLSQFCPDAKTITFGTGFDKPTYLSINADNELEIASNAVTETQPVLVKLTGINYIDSVDFSFYLIIVQAANPTVRAVDELTMRANSSFDLFQIVSGAESLTFRSGRTQPTGSSISNGVFAIGSASGTAYFTATNTNGASHFQIEIVAIGTETLSDFSDTFRHRVLIAGIDVTNDVTVFPEVSVNSDVDTINEYLVNEATIVLRSDQRNGYRFNKGVSSNFWAANNLNIGGFQETVKVYIESLVSGRYVSHLQFTGVIDTDSENFTAATVSLVVLDVSSVLEAEPIEDFGTLEKWDALRQESDESSFSGTYIPERSLLPLQLRTGAAWSDRTALILRDLALPSEGPPIANAAYMTEQDLQTSGGFLENAPILRFKGEHRSEDIRFLFKQLALNSESLYNTEIELPEIETETPYILNRGSVPFSVENTRITRLLTDWVYDSTNARVLMLLSNPEGHIADVLVQYDVDSDTYRILHTFDKAIKTHRITRRNATNYYILTSGPITQDRSAVSLPRAIDSTGYAYDSIAEGSEIKILRYNASTDTLTEHVDETDDRPPQLGIHYYVGFENTIYIDEFEGIVADYRGSFKWQGSNLYYRYATQSEFGVARVNTSGTTTEMIDQATGGHHNHLNFAFDVNGSGDIYCVYAEHTSTISVLKIKRRTSGGVETTLLEEMYSGGGAFLGAHECLFYDDHLYILAPIQNLDLGDNPTNPQADPDITLEQLSPEKAALRNVTNQTDLNPTSTRLAPGDDIPFRIDFDEFVTGATQSDLTVYGGTIQSFSIGDPRDDSIYVTIRPDDPNYHKNIVIDLAEDAVDQDNEAWRITIDFGTRRSRDKAAGMVLFSCDVTAGTPSLTVIEKWDFVTHSACNLIVHDGAVHYTEQPSAAEKFFPINSSL